MNDEDTARYWTVRVHKRTVLGTLLVFLIGGGVYVAIPRYFSTCAESPPEIQMLAAVNTALESYYVDHGRYPDAVTRETLSPYISTDYLGGVLAFLKRECVYIPDTKAVTFVLAWRGPDGEFQVDRATVESATNWIALNLYLQSIRFPIGDVFKSGIHSRESVGDRN